MAENDIPVGALAEVISESVLNALDRRLNIKEFLAGDHVVIVNPIIRMGGRIILAKGGVLKNLELGESAGG